MDDWVSIEEAGRRLHLSKTQVRRLIREGKLEAEQISRPQGYTYRVRLPVGAGNVPPSESGQVALPDTGQAPGTSRDRSQEIILEQLAALTDAHERYAELFAQLTIRDTEIGNLKAEAATYRERAEQLQQQLDAERAALAEARRSWWRRILGA